MNSIWQQRALALHPCDDNTCREGTLLREGMHAAALHALAHATDWLCCEPGSPCLECFSCAAGYFDAFSEQAVQADLAWFEHTFAFRTVTCPACEATLYLGDGDTVGKPVVCGSCRVPATLAHRLIAGQVT